MYREDQSGASFVLGMMTGAFIGAGVALLVCARRPGQRCGSSWVSNTAAWPSVSASARSTSAKTPNTFANRVANACSS